MRRDFLVCFSLANLLFAGSWSLVSRVFDHTLQFSRGAPPSALLLKSVVLNVLLAAAVLSLAALWVRRANSRWATDLGAGAFLVLFAVAIEIVAFSTIENL